MCYSDDLGLLSKYLVHSLSSQEAKTYTAQSICKLLTSAKTFSCCYSKARLAESDAKHILFIWFLFTVYYIFAHILSFSPQLLKPGASQYFLSNLRDRFSIFWDCTAVCGRCARFTRVMMAERHWTQCSTRGQWQSHHTTHLHQKSSACVKCSWTGPICSRTLNTRDPVKDQQTLRS